MAVAVVTGTSSGFGLLIAVELARRGHAVVATMRDVTRDGDLRAACGEAGVTVEVEALDVTDDDSVASAVRSVVDRHGGIDVLVNNAGVGVAGAVEEVPVPTAREVFETNVFGALRMTRAVLGSMRERGSGVIVQISSVAGRVAAPFGGVYSASKFALEGFTEALHYEVAPFGIRVALVEPGSFPTRFDTNRLRCDDDTSPYAGLRRRWEAVYATMPGRDRPDPRAVAVAVAEVVERDDHPLRIPVGGDAEMILAARDSGDFTAFERTMRTVLDFWDGARPPVTDPT